MNREKLAYAIAFFAIGALLVLIMFLANGCSWNFSIRDNLKGVEIRKNEPSPMSETFKQENGKESTSQGPEAKKSVPVPVSAPAKTMTTVRNIDRPLGILIVGIGIGIMIVAVIGILCRRKKR